MDVLSDIILSDEANSTSLSLRHDLRQKDIFSAQKSNKSVGNSSNNLAHKTTEFSTSRSMNTQKNSPPSVSTFRESLPTPINSKVSHHDNILPHHSSSNQLSSQPPVQYSQVSSNPSPQDQEKLLQVNDYSLIPETTGNEYPRSKWSDDISTSQHRDGSFDSLSSDSVDLQFIQRDQTSAPSPHLIQRTYDSSSDSHTSTLDNQELYEPLPSSSSDLDYVRREQTKFWILHGIRKTFSTPSCSHKSSMNGDIETLPSEEDTEQDTEDVLDSLASDSSDLQNVRHDKTFQTIPHDVRRTYSSSSDESHFERDIETLASSDNSSNDSSLASDSSDLQHVQHDEAFERIPHLIRRTYSSGSSGSSGSSSEASFIVADIETMASSNSSSSDASFVDPDIETLASNASTHNEHFGAAPFQDLHEINLHTGSDASGVIPDDTSRLKYGDEDLESWGSSDFAVTRDGEAWPQIARGRVLSRTYSSSEESLGMVDRHACRVLESDDRDLNTRIDRPGCEVENEAESRDEDGANTRSCGKSAERDAPASRKWNVLKRAKRLFGRCVGRVDDRD